MKKIILLVLSLMLIVGCSSESEESNVNVEPIIDVNQFSRINSEQLVQIMGEPESISDFEWTIPATGEFIVGKLYAYEQNKYEFILFEDEVARLNFYSGNYMGYDDSSISFKNENELFGLFNIVPSENFKKIADTNYALRYTPVSDKVAELWIQEIHDDGFDIAKITYNLNFF